MKKQSINDYEKSRNSLIPRAEIFADDVAGEVRPTDDFQEWAARWNKSFFSEMTRLARLAGIVR